MTVFQFTILFFTIGPVSLLTWLVAHIIYRAVCEDNNIPPDASFWAWLGDLMDDRFDDYRLEQKNLLASF